MTSCLRLGSYYWEARKRDTAQTLLPILQTLYYNHHHHHHRHSLAHHGCNPLGYTRPSELLVVAVAAAVFVAAVVAAVVAVVAVVFVVVFVAILK